MPSMMPLSRLQPSSPTLPLIAAVAMTILFQLRTNSFLLVPVDIDTTQPTKASPENDRHQWQHQESSILDFVDATTNPETSCPEHLHLVPDTRLSSISATSSLNAKNASGIPKIVHITAKSRCMTKSFRDNIDKWRFDGYSLLVHNDQAVDRLLNRYWPEFPELQKVAHCLLSGAGKADLWRALIMWEYGGIYTDFDNSPNEAFKNGAAIKDTDEAFFVVEQGGWLSQYFMAATPHHPLMYLLVHKIIQRLYSLNDVDGQYVPRATGPGALKYAFIAFVDDQGPNIYEGHGDCNRRRKYEYGEVAAGLYSGWDNRTVTVVGNKTNANAYVIRESVKQKVKSYHEMNMTHFGEKQQTRGDVESCFRRIYNRDQWAIQHQHN
jgi:mannosyltransferase OCH1-like enzyme